jgi:hypothetical protein
MARKGVGQMMWLPWQQSLRGRKVGSKINILNKKALNFVLKMLDY